MKTLFASLFVALALAFSAQAQDVTYIDSLQASGVTNANTHTQGFSAFVLLREDINDYGTRRFSLYGFNTTDSIKIQGAIINRTRDIPDTVWKDLPITEKLGASVDNWGAGSRDTTYYWFSNVGRVAAQGTAHYTASPAFEIPYGYDLYRVCAAKNDSGKVYVRQHYWEGVFGYVPGPAIERMDRPSEFVACYFEHQRV